MCGICGHVAFSRIPQTARPCVEAMLRSLSHRGPDASGIMNTDLAVVGARRLAIRGLNERANQPMIDPDSGVLVVCNGEIDNHRELRRWLADRGRPVQHETDVAVIPGLYLELGETFVSSLIGAFAIAIWDARNRRLTLVRDRVGERPLFYASTGDQVIFATEIAALVAHGHLPVNLNQNALREYLQFGIFSSPDTPFAEIQKVAPGESIQFSKEGVRRNSYWRWRVVETTKKPPSLDAFDQTFRAAVRRQTDIDVNFGVFLSGGIDSSLVSAVLRSLHPARPLNAYTLRFEEESFDEGIFAEIVAKRFKMELATVWVKPDDVQNGLRALLRLVGEPLADPAWIPAALLAHRAGLDVKVALVGEGADELFGGYPTYAGAGAAERFAPLPSPIKSFLRQLVTALPHSENKVTMSFLLKRFMQGTELDGMTRHQLWVSNIVPALLSRLGIESTVLNKNDTAGGHLLDRVQRWDLEASLAEGLLTKADRASMSSALELRAPFLDEAVLEFAKSLPVHERVRGFKTKVFLKRYALRYLPYGIVNRRKRGLSVPIGRWLRGPLHAWALGRLASGHLEKAGIETSAAVELLSDHRQRKADHARALWTLLVLAEWLEWVATKTPGEPKNQPHNVLFADPYAWRKSAGTTNLTTPAQQDWNAVGREACSPRPVLTENSSA